jgi:hypothetical protein
MKPPRLRTIRRLRPQQLNRTCGINSRVIANNAPFECSLFSELPVVLLVHIGIQKVPYEQYCHVVAGIAAANAV